MTNQPEEMFGCTIHTDAAAAVRIKGLGLTVDGVSKALELALGDRLACTEFDPPAYHGQTRSARTVRYLREQFVTRGWTKDDTSNYSLLVKKTGEVAIQVAGGNEAAGDPASPSPRLAHPKGEMTERSVNRNADQLDLFTGQPDTAPTGPLTWILLLNERSGQLFAELSLPFQFSDGQVIEWQERIILPAISFGETPPPSLVDHPEPASPAPTVHRRTASS